MKVQPRFRNSIVLKYSDESDLVNAVLDMLPDSEVVFRQMYFSYCECMHIFHFFSLNSYIMQPCCKIENSILESTDPTELESVS